MLLAAHVGRWTHRGAYAYNGADKSQQTVSECQDAIFQKAASNASAGKKGCG